jgi:hypothetical protein
MEKAEVLTSEFQFHLLRHFSRVDDDYLENFISISGFTRKEVIQQLELQGSRFLYSFAPNPSILWDKVYAMIFSENYRSKLYPGRKVYSLHFDERSYPEGIGLCNLVALNELNPVEKESVREEKRGEHMIRVISGIPPVLTWILNVVEVIGEENYISTIFPGTYAPPFPDREEQSEEEYLENSRFWESHAIISR